MDAKIEYGSVMNEFFAGLDLGQMADFSAIVVAERVKGYDAVTKEVVYTFDVRHIYRWPLKTPYPTVVDDVRALYAIPPLAGSTLAIDETGVGKPVVDLFRRGGIDAHLRPLSITCGSKNTGSTVAKKHLVGAVQAALCSGRVRFAKGLELTPVLQAELKTFNVTVDERTRNESYAAWRSTDHDDLVLALALALHVGRGSSFAMAAAEIPNKLPPKKENPYDPFSTQR
jgi:hypothetical protein